MNNIENIIKNVMSAMQESLDEEQLQKLENTLYIQFHGLKLQEECTQLVTSESGWQKILKLYAASKRLENCADSTIRQYTDCVMKLITTLNKRLRDITTNDIRYYLAMVQYLTWTRYGGICLVSSRGAVTKDSFQEILCGVYII